MPRPDIEEFAKVLIREVRDRSIVSCDSQLKPESNSPAAKRWRECLRSTLSDRLAETMIPDCVDDVLFHLLHAIDSGALRLSYVASNGDVIDLTEEGLGELAGWYAMGSGGWRPTYSQQRFVDDFEDFA